MREFCLNCIHLKDNYYWCLGYCPHYHIYKHKPFHNCTNMIPYRSFHLQNLIDHHKKLAAKSLERAELIDKYIKGDLK